MWLLIVVRPPTGSSSVLLPSKTSSSLRYFQGINQLIRQLQGGLHICKKERPVILTAINRYNLGFVQLQVTSTTPYQEPENQVVTKGRSLTLSCFVNADKPVQYYWYKMDTLPSGDMTSDDHLYLAGGLLLLVIRWRQSSQLHKIFFFPGNTLRMQNNI